MTRLLAFTGVVAISFTAIFFRLAGVDAVTGAFFRTAYAVPVLLLLWLAAARGRDRRTPNMRLAAAASGLLLSVDLVCWHRAIDLIGAGLATVVANAQILFVGMAAWWRYGERPTRLAMLMVPLGFAGIGLISGLGRPDAFGADPVRGVALGLVAAVCYSGFLLILRGSNPVLAPAVGPLLDSTVGAAVGSLAAALVADPGFTLRPSWPAHGWLLALALVGQAFGWLMVTYALPRLPALETSVLLMLQPVLTVFWAVLLFGEDLSGVQWLGVLLVLGSVGLLSARGSVQAPRPASATAR